MRKKLDTQERVRKLQEEQKRQELKGCTFHPVITSQGVGNFYDNLSKHNISSQSSLALQSSKFVQRPGETRSFFTHMAQ